MLHSKTLTISFVLPFYLKMWQHLQAVVESTSYSFLLQSAAEKGLAKLEKYFLLAKGHHAYILGTGMTILHVFNCSDVSSQSYTLRYELNGFDALLMKVTPRHNRQQWLKWRHSSNMLPPHIFRHQLLAPHPHHYPPSLQQSW